MVIYYIKGRRAGKHSASRLSHLYWIVPGIINVTLIVTLVTAGVFQKALLPNASFF
jgi:hypothetical protein